MRVWQAVSIGLPALVILAGCQGLTPQQRASLAAGERAYAQKRYAAAISQLTQFLKQSPDSPEASRAHYVRGMSQALAGQRGAAYADLRQAAGGVSDPEVAWRALAVLGVLNFEDEQWDAAALAFRRAVEQMPAVPPLDAFLYRLGLCYERTGRWSDALTVYRRILTSFPQGAYAEQAARRVQLQADHLAVQAGVFSQRERADLLAGRLREGGLDARVCRQLRSGELYYVVLVGRYESYAEAVKTLRRVRGLVPDAMLWP